MSEMHDDPALPRWQRLLLPSGMLEARGGRRSARDWIVDLTMFAIAVGIGIFVLAETWGDHSELAAVVDIVLGVACSLALWARRSRPTEVAVAVVAASFVSALAAGPGVIAILNAAIRVPGRVLAGIALLSFAGTAVFPLLYPGRDSYGTQLVVGILINAVLIGWGLFVRAQRQLVHSLQERARAREDEHRRHLEQAREAERRRIAGEMHDVLAHRVSLLSLHAGALEFRPDAPADEIAEAAGVIRATAHAALEDLREVIGVLREGGEGGAPEPPQPTLAQIPALVEESRAVGMTVDLLDDVVAGPVPPAALGRTAYRIVQEGLTNARKHAPGAAVRVTLATGEGPRLVVAVASRPAVGVAARGAGERLPGAGTGLVGLAERVALAGGRLQSGPDAGGDFVLQATLPWTP